MNDEKTLSEKAMFIARRCVMLAAALGLAALQGCVLNLPPIWGEQRGPLQTEILEQADRFLTRDQVLVIDLTGVVSIAGSDGPFRGKDLGMLVTLKDRLKKAEDDKRVKAVVLRIDSPGGGVTASDLIYHEIKRFKKETELPVVAMMQDIAASGGLYVAMAADEIYAMPTTTTGSIGVIAMLPDLQGLSEKIGLEMRVLKTGENKDMGSPWADLKPEQRKLLMDLLDSMYERFVSTIVDSRSDAGLTREKLMEIADGRVVTPEVAEQYKLIDGVAYPEEVIDRAKELAGIDDASVVSYQYPFQYRGNIYAQSGSARSPLSGGDVNMFKLDLGLGQALPRDTRLMYLWLP